jgi:ABC-type phosphate transport system auxiliary subunit
MLTAFCWGVALLATFWFDAGGPFEWVAKVAAAIFFGIALIGLIRFLYAFLFVKDHAPNPELPASQFSADVATAGETVRPALSAHESIPLTDWPRRPNTREMARQPSVTENTTRLLDELSADYTDYADKENQ